MSNEKSKFITFFDLTQVNKLVIKLVLGFIVRQSFLLLVIDKVIVKAIDI